MNKKEQAKIKDSKLRIILTTKSGYSEKSTHTISLNQWNSINKILNK